MRVAFEQGAEFEEALEVLLPSEPYLDYANFPAVARREGALHELHRGRWRAAAAQGRVWIARDQGGRPLAALAYAPRPFESDHFSLRMAKVEAPLAVATDEPRRSVLRVLYRSAWEELARMGYQHVAAVASTSDRVTGWTLQEVGSFHVGTRITWMEPLTGEQVGPGLAPDLRFEVYDRQTARQLPASAYRRLLDWCRTAFDRGPYVFDLGVPHNQALRIYEVWSEKALTGEWADTLIVVRDGDEVVAFHSMILLPDLSQAAGVGVVGHGIGATLPGYPGLFTALQRETSARKPMGAGYLENEAQSSSIQSIQVFGKLGHRCIRSLASFHRML